MIDLALPLLCASVLSVVIAPLLARITPVAARRAAVAVLLPLAIATLALLSHFSLQAMVALPVIGARLHSWLHLDGVHIVRGSSAGVIAPLFASVVVVKVVLMLAAQKRLRGLHPGGVVTLSDKRRYAYAIPGRRPGIIVSEGLISSLSPAELDAVLRHEQAHIDGRHDLWLLVARACVVLNPILIPVKRQLEFALERIADAAAKRDCGDTHIVVSALSKAALGPSYPTASLGIKSSSVAARVRWLKSGVSHSNPVHLTVVLTGCLVVVCLSVIQGHHILAAIRAVCA